MKRTMAYLKKFDSLKFLAFGLIVAICSGCSNAAPAAKTEVLPPDGGELGKAFIELVDAFKTADKVKAGKLLNPTEWHLENKEANWFKMFNDQLAGYKPTGGRRQGDRATLFIVTEQPYYAMMNATYVKGVWQFDAPTPMGSSFSSSSRDCKTTPKRFPCGSTSAPDTQVSGTIQSSKVDPLTKQTDRPRMLLDGLAVRILDSETKSLKSTWILLSATGINPQMIALSDDPESVKGWLGWPVLTLEVTPDGKNAKLEYYDGYSRKSLDVTNGLNIDTSTPNRINGQLKLDAKDVAKFDVKFDIGTASDCIVGAYQCGE